jgi:hypothetical protein
MNIVNFNDLKFEAPVLNQLVTLNRHYYTQNLKYRGNDLYIQTDWFRANGTKDTFDHKKELMVTLPSDFRMLLKGIEDFAIRDGLKLPMEFQSNLSNEEIFKHIPERTNLYLKMHHEVACFDKAGHLMKMDALTTGDYRAVILVKGLYIGFHPTGKLVSLQLRIAQLQFIPRVPQCMFVPVPNFHLPQASVASNMIRVPETPQAGAESMPLSQATNKRGRKPAKLQRQNAISEGKIQQEEHRRLESVPADFFQDAMMDLANA